MTWREVPHTADWAIRVTAPALPDLFVDAAAGMYALVGCETSYSDIAAPERIDLEGVDHETLLVAFLDELLYALESRRVAYIIPNVELGEERLRAEVVPAEVTSISKEIKAVTFHGLEIVESDGQFDVTIIFDV